jgi:hypothetical protein
MFCNLLNVRIQNNSCALSFLEGGKDSGQNLPFGAYSTSGCRNELNGFLRGSFVLKRDILVENEENRRLAFTTARASA